MKKLKLNHCDLAERTNHILVIPIGKCYEYILFHLINLQRIAQKFGAK